MNGPEIKQFHESRQRERERDGGEIKQSKGWIAADQKPKNQNFTAQVREAYECR